MRKTRVVLVLYEMGSFFFLCLFIVVALVIVSVPKCFF